MTQTQTADEFLEHFGVKGMKWGKRKANDSGASKPPSNRQLNKQSRIKDGAEIVATTKAARERLASGKTKSDFNAAKAKAKAAKATVGSREAKKMLNEARAWKALDVRLANNALTGKELTRQMIRGGVLGFGVAEAFPKYRA